MGASSEAMLVKVAIDLKENVNREEREIAVVLGGQPSRANRSVEGDSGEADGGGLSWPSRRLQFWHMKLAVGRCVDFIDA